MPSLAHTARRVLTRATHRIYTLPVLVLMPHGRCNCRCVMCDIWRANRHGQTLTPADLAPHVEALRSLGVQWVVLSGGEALMHPNLWTLCALLRELNVKITLLSTGLLLGRHAEAVVRWCDEVIVSLDGSRDVHDRIRNVPRAFDRLAEGVAALNAREAAFRVTGRCVLQRSNYFDLRNTIDAAHALGLDQISFLAADVSTEAFNRPEPWPDERVAEVALAPDEVEAFAQEIEAAIVHNADDFASGFVAERPDRLRQLPQYFAALNGQREFPKTTCNAPWVSAVIEVDGAVRPCFFHPAYGNLHEAPLEAILNNETAVTFRRTLDVHSDPICRKCVCTLHLGATTAL